jgi:single-stranded-DNA-specific exonuclease
LRTSDTTEVPATGPVVSVSGRADDLAEPAPRGLRARWSRRGTTVETGGSLVERILRARGIVEPERVEAYLNPSLRHLHDPSLLPDADRAAERIVQALQRRETIVIYGDYDVDGVTATAVLWHTLRELEPGADVRTYIPHRIDEGYGLSEAAIAQLAQEGASVIVSVDCGITAVGPAKAAREAGVDLIITDHHNPPDPGDPLPEAYALVHPRLPGSVYPFGELCGAGVAYKLAWRIVTTSEGADRVSPRLRELLVHLLAFAALGSVADVVPLEGENRVIGRFGLGRVKRSPFAGLRALVDASGLGGEDIDAERVAFTLAPRLNACGRLGHARDAVRMFTEASYEEAYAIAEELNTQNAARRRIEDRIVEQASEMAEARGMTGLDRRVIVLAHPDWHPGVVGIACSRLSERYCRPVVLLADDGAQCAGSGRSVRGVSLHAALSRCSGLLDRWGGHDMAAGMSLARINLDAFTESLTREVNTLHPASGLVPTLGYDCEAELGELTLETVGAIGSLGPFGAGNPSVRLRIGGLELAEPARRVGREGRHLQLRVRTADGRAWVKCIAWRFGEEADRLSRGEALEVLARPMLSTWNGSTSVQLEVQDLRKARPAP